jgi:hypothetical protein
MSTQRTEMAVTLRLKKKIFEELELADITTAITNSNQGIQNQIVNFTRHGREPQLGKAILRAVADYVHEKAVAEAAAILADNNITLAELERILD